MGASNGRQQKSGENSPATLELALGEARAGTY